MIESAAAVKRHEARRVEQQKREARERIERMHTLQREQTRLMLADLRKAQDLQRERLEDMRARWKQEMEARPGTVWKIEVVAGLFWTVVIGLPLALTWWWFFTRS